MKKKDSRNTGEIINNYCSYKNAESKYAELKENEIRTEINKEKACIIRLDGVGMTQKFKIKKPINKQFMIAMEAATDAFNKSIKSKENHFFDCRLIQIDRTKICEYFSARQAFAIWQFAEKLRNLYIPNERIQAERICDLDTIIKKLRKLHRPVIYSGFSDKSKNGVLTVKNANGMVDSYGAKPFLDNLNYLKDLVKRG